MTLKDKLTAEPGFNYIIDSMEFMCSPGKRCMLQQTFVSDPAMLNSEYDNIGHVIRCLEDPGSAKAVSTIRHQLMQMHDLQGSLANLHQHIVLEEIELFEIKNLSFLCMETVKAARTINIDSILGIPDLGDVFALLDPDNTHIANFYIYDSYHPDLPQIRKQLKAKQSLLDNSNDSVDSKAELQRQINELYEQQNLVQQTVMASLTDKLYDLRQQLSSAHDSMAYTDMLFAKATLALQWNLQRPVFDAHHTAFKQLWNPRLMHRNKELNLRYQPVDIELQAGVCFVTGANMAGKTVLLKTIGIAQLMAQFGLFVPAREAVISPVSDVAFCIGDEQNEMNGLSSFASEIIKISDNITRAESEKMLILIDEPARTTNPVEGKALVQAVASLLDRRDSFTVITTHYSQLQLPCRRLRVKGFVEGLSDMPLTPQNINQFMDYSLLNDDSDDVPQEAIRIASIMHCNPSLIDTARDFLENGETPSQ